jgi:hypothetical protein
MYALGKDYSLISPTHKIIGTNHLLYKITIYKIYHAQLIKPIHKTPKPRRALLARANVLKKDEAF